MNLFLYMYLFTALACNREIHNFFLLLAIRCEKKKKRLRVRALNLTVPLGSGWVRRSRVRAGFGLQF